MVIHRQTSTPLLVKHFQASLEDLSTAVYLFDLLLWNFHIQTIDKIVIRWKLSGPTYVSARGSKSLEVNEIEGIPRILGLIYLLSHGPLILIHIHNEAHQGQPPEAIHLRE